MNYNYENFLNIFHFLTPTKVTFHGNPWSCDCGMQKVFDELVAETDRRDIFKSALSNGRSHLTCAGPEQMTGRSIFDLTASDLASAPCLPPTITR